MILKCVRMGRGAPVVLLHGLYGSAANWGRIQRRLAEGFDVRALDLRNHGGSPHGLPADYATMAGDVAETLAAEGVAEVRLVGHSMGGKVAMRLALDRPALVERLVVADIAPVQYAPHFREITEALRRLELSAGMTRAMASAALEPAVPDPALRGFLLQNLRFTERPGWRIGLEEIAAGLVDIEGWTGTGVYAGPVLVLRGERSDYVRPEHRGLFRALFPAARFASLRDAGHWLHADNPEGFLATVAPFLGAVRSAA